jgi:hypothetical protein
MKVCSPAFAMEGKRPKGAIEIDGPSGRRYDFRKGIQDVSKSDAKAILDWGGFLPSMTGPTRKGIGYRCTKCGFGSFFKTCSRCGSDATREAYHPR